MRWTLACLASLGAAVLLTVPSSLVHRLDALHQDKIEHAVLFLVLATVWLHARAPAWAVTGCLILFAVGSELAQYLMGLGRTGDAWDAAADLVGIVIGLAAVALTGRWRSGLPA